LKQSRSAILIAITGNLLFGVIPIYWKWLAGVNNLYILGHRMVWSILFTILFAAIDHKLPKLKEAFHNKRALLIELAAAVTIVVNWYLYTWAINADMVAETSIAYYMAPLVVILFGVFAFHETISKWEVIAIVLSAIGIVIAAIGTGTFPWVSILLALTFSLYGVLKKLAGLDSAVALTVEMTLLLPFSLIYLGVTSFGSSGQLLSCTWWEILLLIGTGFASSFPLWFYGKGIKELPLTLVGIFQYIWPTTSLLMSIFVFRETVSPAKFVCLGFIWVGILISMVPKFVHRKTPEQG
jgi:chloramphenicol-sensitive protein RarD